MKKMRKPNCLKHKYIFAVGLFVSLVYAIWGSFLIIEGVLDYVSGVFPHIFPIAGLAISIIISLLTLAPLFLVVYLCRKRVERYMDYISTNYGHLGSMNGYINKLSV